MQFQSKVQQGSDFIIDLGRAAVQGSYRQVKEDQLQRMPRPHQPLFSEGDSNRMFPMSSKRPPVQRKTRAGKRSMVM